MDFLFRICVLLFLFVFLFVFPLVMFFYLVVFFLVCFYAFVSDSGAAELLLLGCRLLGCFDWLLWLVALVGCFGWLLWFVALVGRLLARSPTSSVDRLINSGSLPHSRSCM